MSEKYPLHTFGFALAIATTSAIAIVTLTIASMVFNWAEGIVLLIAQCYVGYSPSVSGTLVGTLWAFIDGFITGFLISWFYNRIVSCTKC